MGTASIRTFDPADAERLATGWPHVRAFSNAKSKKSPEERASAVIGRVDPPASVAWSREVAQAYLRGHALRIGKHSAADLTTLRGSEPLDDAELAACLAGWLGKGRYWFHFENALLLAEQLVGSAKVVDLVCDWLDARSASGWKGGHLDSMFATARTTPHCIGLLVGFPLLRVPADAPQRARLTEIRDAGPADTTLRQLLDLVLDGGAAARRLGVRRLQALHFAGDDPQLITEVSANDPLFSTLTPRFPWLGGRPVLAHFATRMAGSLPAYFMGRAVDEFGVFAEPEVLPLMAALANHKRTASRATKWFAAHADFVAQHQAALAEVPNGDEILRSLGNVGSAPPPEPKSLTREQLEAELGALLQRTADTYRSTSDKVVCLKKALREYDELRSLAGLDPDERAGHFFMLDGTSQVGPLPELLSLDEAGSEELADAFDAARD